MSRARIVVLASGSGSNLQAVLDATGDGRLRAVVAGVVSDRPDGVALSRAIRAGIEATSLPSLPGEERHAYDRRLADAVALFTPDWIVLAGWMRLLLMSFLARFPGRVVNLHPALPGEFPGLHAIDRAHAAAAAGTISRTGVMVHLVPDEGVDDGPVLGWREVPIFGTDSLADLEARIHDVEHELLVEVLARQLVLEDR